MLRAAFLLLGIILALQECVQGRYYAMQNRFKVEELDRLGRVEKTIQMTNTFSEYIKYDKSELRMPAASMNVLSAFDAMPDDYVMPSMGVSDYSNPFDRFTHVHYVNNVAKKCSKKHDEPQISIIPIRLTDDLNIRASPADVAEATTENVTKSKVLEAPKQSEKKTVTTAKSAKSDESENFEGLKFPEIIKEAFNSVPVGLSLGGGLQMLKDYADSYENDFPMLG